MKLHRCSHRESAKQPRRGAARAARRARGRRPRVGAGLDDQHASTGAGTCILHTYQPGRLGLAFRLNVDHEEPRRRYSCCRSEDLVRGREPVFRKAGAPFCGPCIYVSGVCPAVSRPKKRGNEGRRKPGGMCRLHISSRQWQVADDCGCIGFELGAASGPPACPRERKQRRFVGEATGRRDRDGDRPRREGLRDEFDGGPRRRGEEERARRRGPQKGDRRRPTRGGRRRGEADRVVIEGNHDDFRPPALLGALQIDRISQGKARRPPRRGGDLFAGLGAVVGRRPLPLEELGAGPNRVVCCKLHVVWTAHRRVDEKPALGVVEAVHRLLIPLHRPRLGPIDDGGELDGMGVVASGKRTNNLENRVLYKNLEGTTVARNVGRSLGLQLFLGLDGARLPRIRALHPLPLVEEARVGRSDHRPKVLFDFTHRFGFVAVRNRLGKDFDDLRKVPKKQPLGALKFVMTDVLGKGPVALNHLAGDPLWAHLFASQPWVCQHKCIEFGPEELGLRAVVGDLFQFGHSLFVLDAGRLQFGHLLGFPLLDLFAENRVGVFANALHGGEQIEGVVLGTGPLCRSRRRPTVGRGAGNLAGSPARHLLDDIAEEEGLRMHQGAIPLQFGVDDETF
ncbi:hypothetical protein OUZ56_032675 [Daphnia magna]|uniref:Uncharacterized protein n=1 Tax=Daphnia magna TaxID=35525 RepID=A0ABR0B9L4_9CRUS|nr:hypothetical protein OUZ56_032675 [Daphnia magna]